jgi:hypothetical protein
MVPVMVPVVGKILNPVYWVVVFVVDPLETIKAPDE